MISSSTISTTRGVAALSRGKDTSTRGLQHARPTMFRADSYNPKNFARTFLQSEELCANRFVPRRNAGASNFSGVPSRAGRGFRAEHTLLVGFGVTDARAYSSRRIPDRTRGRPARSAGKHRRTRAIDCSVAHTLQVRVGEVGRAPRRSTIKITRRTVPRDMFTFNRMLSDRAANCYSRAIPAIPPSSKLLRGRTPRGSRRQG
jgi:hypothetical protein